MTKVELLNTIKERTQDPVHVIKRINEVSGEKAERLVASHVTEVENESIFILFPGAGLGSSGASVAAEELSEDATRAYLSSIDQGLQNLHVDAILRNVSRADMIALLSSLVKLDDIDAIVAGHTEVSICGVSYSADALMYRWNNANPEEKPIQYARGIEV